VRSNGRTTGWEQQMRTIPSERTDV
jgi:hypothetical protein